MSSIPFPFLGQGDAGYFETFEMWIWFQKPVPAAKRKAVLDGAPPPCLDSVEWAAPDLLYPGTTRIQRQLVSAYGTPAAKKKQASALRRIEAGDDGDDALDDALAGSSHEQAFHQHLERWLRAVHRSHPILFAVRRQDHEAGGTKLGAWHDASLVGFPERVGATFTSVVKKRLASDDKRRTPIRLALEYAGVDAFPPAVRELAGQMQSADDREDRNTARAVSIEWMKKTFAKAKKIADGIERPRAAFRVLSAVTDDVYCMGRSLEPKGAHALVLSLVDRALRGRFSETWAAWSTEMSIYQVSVAYAGSLEAAAWAENRAAFDAVRRLVDVVSPELAGYLQKSAARLEAKRSAFAGELRALAPKT